MNIGQIRIFSFWPLLFVIIIYACNNPDRQLINIENSSAQRNINEWLTGISEQVSEKGPTAWLNYFERSPDFFMASEGALAFTSYDAADSFISHVLVKNIKTIKLAWTDIKIESLNKKFALIGAQFHENISYFNGTTQPEDGYFTGIAVMTGDGWKLRNLHWSTPNVKS